MNAESHASTPVLSAPSRLLTVARTAEALSVSTRSVWRLIAGGELQVVRLGRSVRITTASVEKLIDRGGAR